ncbi:MAG: tetratricopeptide repeat protein [Candidatus Tectomicrobia bacterium]|uniref:Tetratricopeptide repeat protein n=1 Tax=Tectimicrobiota bacterium TaxID=2528274 RepID=A0A932CR32_UNCTE|nr:tetratricopeptide repeat protein [Candidatus Tectomicrobia bacterium]
MLQSLAGGAVLLAALHGTLGSEEAQYLRSLQTGKELYSRGEHEKAMEELKQAVTLQPNLAEAHFLLGIIYARMGKNDLARERFARVVELEPDHVQSHNNLGVIYQSIGLVDLAQEEFRKAIQIDPGYEPAIVNLARLYLSLAARQYEDLIKLKPDDPEITRLYRRILALDPASPKAHYSLARLLIEEGKEAEALEELRQAERLDPAYGPIRLYQEGRSQEKAGNYLEAAKEYRLALQLRPDYPEAHYRLGMTHYFLEHYPEAVVELEQVVDKKEVDQAELHHYLGHSYSQLGQGDRAMVQLQKALALKETPQSHWLLGQEYERRKDPVAAEREYQEVARLDPANQEVAARLEALKARTPSSAVADQPAIAPTPPETASAPSASLPEKKEWEMVQDLVLRWKDAWEKKRLEDYMAFYSRDFASQGMGWEGWRRYKEGINQKAQRIQVSISDLKTFRHQDSIGVVFRQGYRSGQHSDEGWKRLYLKKEEGGRWRIVGEEWSPR